MQTLRIINIIISIIFFVCYTYQFLYVPLYFILKNRRKNKGAETASAAENHRYALMICARNEAAVIGDLIESIHKQNYPQDKLTIFVMADNCTDDTARVAEEVYEKALISMNQGQGKSHEELSGVAGDGVFGRRSAAAANQQRVAQVVVYTRQNRQEVGKGYALKELMRRIRRDFGDVFDGFLVFDADNVLDEGYMAAMNRSFSEGNEIITSYRNSKNYGVNWISAGYGLWFLRESRFLNHVRYLLGTSCAVSGTGFLFSRKVAAEIGDWPFHMLTEDIEFSIHEITRGRWIAFCSEARLYDEQPVSFRQSWRQRMRWSRGYLQVFGGYGGDLIKGIFKGSFSCFDMAMTIMPAFILTSFSVVSNLSLGIWGAVIGDDIRIALESLGTVFMNMYLLLFIIGTITTITEWRRIQTTPLKRVLYVFTFPLFMATYIPIAFVSLFCRRVTWKPITHSYSLEKMRQISQLEKK